MASVAMGSNPIAASIPMVFRSLLSLLRSILLHPDSSRHDRALFETTRRLLAEIINEGLVDATISGSSDRPHLNLLPRDGMADTKSNAAKWVRVGIKPGTVLETKDDRVVAVVRPDSLQPPVVIGFNGEGQEREELEPGTLFQLLSPWMVEDANEDVLDEIAHELSNSAKNQGESMVQQIQKERMLIEPEKWLEVSESQKLLSLDDASVDWERSLIYGHPSHPYHRLCYAQPPLQPVQPEDIPEMLTPPLAFLSVPRTDMRLTGDFEQIIQPLLKTLSIPETSSDRVVVPCLSRQLPSVFQRFPNAVVLKTVTECADAQASMRTLTLRPECQFGYHLKLSLACHITSALRTITPWTTCGGPVQTALLEKFLPSDLWVFREVASISGGQDDFSDARHLSCILRDDLEDRAQANNETLVITAALAQQPHASTRTYAEILYNLQTAAQKQAWFRKYITRLFDLVLPPLVRYGIGLEAHGQNLVARICRETGIVKGFAVRDFGGVRMHVPTLRAHGVNFDSLPPGGATLTEDLHNVWSKVHHALLQNHVGLLLNALGLEREGGWTIVRETLERVLKEEEGGGKGVLEYFMQDTMPFKCFLRMRMEGKYRDYVEREVPNVLLMESSRWESVIRDYQPLLHYT